MAVIRPFATTTVTSVAVSTMTATALTSTIAALGAPVEASQIFFQRVYGVTINISDEGLESLDVLTTVDA